MVFPFSTDCQGVISELQIDARVIPDITHDDLGHTRVVEAVDGVYALSLVPLSLSLAVLADRTPLRGRLVCLYSHKSKRQLGVLLLHFVLLRRDPCKNDLWEDMKNYNSHLALCFCSSLPCSTPVSKDTKCL